MPIHIHSDPQQMICCKAPTDLVERLERACRDYSCTKSSLMRQLLHHGLNQLSVAPSTELHASAGAKADA